MLELKPREITALLPSIRKPYPFGRVQPYECEERAAWLSRRSIKNESKLWALRKIIAMCDLTTLEGADTKGKIRDLCAKAKNPYTPHAGMPILKTVNSPSVAAVCVYPSLITTAKEFLKGSTVRVASVATGFPSGQYPSKIKLEDTRLAIQEGADEIDMVINRAMYLSGHYQNVFDDVRKVKDICGNLKLKVILESGELGTYDAIRNASFIAMLAGADFIKTSTGKIQPAATLPVALVMMEAIRDFYNRFGKTVGFKAAGGIRTSKDAIRYLIIAKETLGDDWINPNRLRFGASALLNDLLAQIVKQLTGSYRSSDEFSLE